MTDRPDPREVVAPLVVDAIVHQYGERCPEFAPDCPCCQVWSQYDALTASGYAIVPAAEGEVGELVEKLRRYTERATQDFDGRDDWFIESASHLERLAAENERLTEASNNFWTAVTRAERAEAANERLKAAIRALLDCPDIADNDYKDEETHAAERLARATLTQEPS